MWGTQVPAWPSVSEANSSQNRGDNREKCKILLQKQYPAELIQWKKCPHRLSGVCSFDSVRKTCTLPSNTFRSLPNVSSQKLNNLEQNLEGNQQKPGSQNTVFAWIGCFPAWSFFPLVPLAKSLLVLEMGTLCCGEQNTHTHILYAYTCISSKEPGTAHQKRHNQIITGKKCRECVEIQFLDAAEETSVFHMLLPS